MKRRFSSVVMIALLLASLSLFAVRSDSIGRGQQLSVVKHKQLIESFSMPEVTSISSYSWLRIDNCSYNSIPGQPMLPVRSFVFKLPEGSSVTGIKAEVKESYLQGSFRVVPTPLPVKAGTEGLIGDLSENPKIYESSDVFPAQWYVFRRAHGLDPEKMVRVEYAIINFYPLRFIPNENRVLRAETVSVSVDYVEADVSPLVVTLRNLIITSDTLEPYAIELAEYKNDTGTSSKVVNTTWIYGHYAGIDNQEKIRNCIKDFAATYGVIYVTIFGDADQVPVRLAYVPDGMDTYTPTDLYYADLDGTWDDNNDGLYADQRYDTVDGVPDVYVGRIPPSLDTYAQAAVDKIKGYQQQFNASQSWTQRIVLAAGTGHNGIENRFGNATTVLKEYISGIATDKNIVKLYESAGNLSTDNMGFEIDEGALFVNFAGHGDSGAGFGAAGWLFYWVIPGLIWNGFGISDVQSRTNGFRLPVVTTMSCSTARFDDADCIGEWFVLEPDGGSIAYFGATRVAWGYANEWSPYGLMGEMDRMIYESFYEGSTKLGQMWGDTVGGYVQNHIWNYKDASIYDVKTFMEFELLGDPTLRIYNPDYPSTLKVPEDCETIQGAINAAYNGDTILVSTGTYHENVVVNKTVSLIGENAATTILNGGGASVVISITASNTQVSGFTVTNGDTGILLKSSRCLISGNNITGNIESIYFDQSSNNTISGNNIAVLFYGLRLDYSSANTFLRNNITDVGGRYGVGVSLHYSSNNLISENNITDNYYYGISLSGSSNNTVSGNNIRGSSNFGIYLESSNNNSVSGNNITDNSYGISIFVSSSNNSVSGNNVVNNSYGIWVHNSHKFNNISGNSIANNWFGIYLESCSNTSISGNEFFNDGLTVQESYGHVVVDNLVYGKPLVYLENVSDYVVEDAGQVILVNCNRITVENLNLSHTDIGVELWQTNNTKISGNNITNSDYGIYLGSSSGNIVSGNNITANRDHGIWLYASPNNIVSENNITQNGDYGVYLERDSWNNTISANWVADNGVGIGLRGSPCGPHTVNNSIINNEIVSNEYGVYLHVADNNSISGNRIEANALDGIVLDSHDLQEDGYYPSQNNTITQNIIGGNRYGVLLLATWNNRISCNNITGNVYGIGLDWLPSDPYGNYYCKNNTIVENFIATNSQSGIQANSSTHNSIFHNNFIDNGDNAEAENSTDIWDYGYPSGGNYWSDYIDVDLYSGSNQDVPGSDGIWDHPYELDEDNQDRYPLVNPWAMRSDSYLAVRGGHNEIYYRIYNATVSSWESWNVVPEGATCDSPGAAMYSGKLYFVVRGMDGQSLWFGSVNLTDDSFSGWTLLSGASPSAPTLVSYDSKLVLVVRGFTNIIYYRSYDCVSETWTEWVPVPDGATCDSPAAAVLGTDLHLVVRGFSTTDVWGNNTLWHGTVNLADDSFSGWTSLPGATPSAPSLAASETLGNLYLTVRGMSDVIWINNWNGVAWEGWTALPDGATCDSPAATVINGELHIVVRGMTGMALWHYYIDLSTDAHSGWITMDGYTPSAPRLNS